MRWPNVPKMFLSLMVALFAAMSLMAINEIAHRQSAEALDNLREAQLVRLRVNQIIRYVLDAETGQRGYLLTASPRYLEPYDIAVVNVGKTLQQLREFSATSPELSETVNVLAAAVSRKMSEIALTVAMRKEGKDDAWRFVLTTDVGVEQMETIRAQADVLYEASLKRTSVAYAKISRSLQLARIGIALVSAIGLIAFYLYLRQKRTLETERKRQQAQLQAEHDRLEHLVEKRTASLAELATHLQQVREDERGYLARELHDELGAILTAAKLDVARLKGKLGTMSDDVVERVKHLVDTLNNGIALKRRIIEDLRPSSLSNLGLGPALEILTREFGERSGLAVTTEFEEIELDASRQLTVYRLIQEALTNIAKYAEARNVEVLVLRRENHMTVSVKDDGIGFDAKLLRASGYGLAGMRHRVLAAGGRLHVQSSPGEGTRISALLPMGERGAIPAA